jgi:hypothetical protein
MTAFKIKSVEDALSTETHFARRQGLLKELWHLQHAPAQPGVSVKDTSKETSIELRSGVGGN